MSPESPSVSDANTPAANPLPKNLPIELLPLYDWWKSNGIQSLSSLAAVVVLVCGVQGFRYYRANRLESASRELTRAQSLDELESLVARYGSTRPGNAARLRLAKSYYDSGRYEEALTAYDACLKRGAPKGFEEVTQLGRAHALEGLNRLEEALAAYEAFHKSAAGHFLHPQARMGQARIYTLQGRKEEALRLLENLKAEKTGDDAWEMTIASLEGVVKRYTPRAARSLFEAADEAAQTLAQPPVQPLIPVPTPAAAPADTAPAAP